MQNELVCERCGNTFNPISHFANGCPYEFCSWYCANEWKDNLRWHYEHYQKTGGTLPFALWHAAFKVKIAEAISR